MIGESKRRSGWEPGTPVTALQQVWDYVSEKIRECRLRLSRIESRYYGKFRTAENHCKHLCNALRGDNGFRSNVNLHYAVKKTLAGNDIKLDVNLPMELVDWVHDLMAVRESLKELSRICQSDILDLLSTYCSSYFPTIGANDDRLFTLYRSKTVSINKTTKRINLMLENLDKDDEQVNMEKVELLQCECQNGHTLTRAVPLLIEDVEQLLDKSYDWLTIDKCYLDEISDSILASRGQLKKLDKQCKMCTSVYHASLAALRQEKIVLESLNSELTTFSVKELRETELRSHRVDLEIRSLEQTLNQLAREEMAGDVPDCCLDEFEEKSSSSTDKAYYLQR